MARGIHLFPFRTEKLSPSAPMVLGPQGPGRVGRRRIHRRGVGAFGRRPRTSSWAQAVSCAGAAGTSGMLKLSRRQPGTSTTVRLPWLSGATPRRASRQSPPAAWATAARITPPCANTAITSWLPYSPAIALEHVDDAILELGEALAALPGHLAGLVPADGAGLGGEDLGPLASRPRAGVDLAQGDVGDHRQAAQLRRGRGGVERADEVGGVDRNRPQGGHGGRDRRRLGDAGRRQRAVAVPLPPALGVPVGLAVSQEMQPRHVL